MSGSLSDNPTFKSFIDELYNSSGTDDIKNYLETNPTDTVNVKLSLSYQKTVNEDVKIVASAESVSKATTAVAASRTTSVIGTFEL